MSGGGSITEIVVKTIGKNIRNVRQLAAMARGVPEPAKDECRDHL